MRYLLCFCLLLGSLLPAHAQLIWQRFYGGPDLDDGYTMIRLRQGGYLMGGAPDMHLIRVDEAGDTLWTHYYTTGYWAMNAAYSLAENRSGQILVAGGGSGYDLASHRFDVGFLMLMDGATGQQHWLQSYVDTTYSSFYSACLANDGNFVVMGRTQDTTKVWKIDSTGALLWSSVVPYDSTYTGVPCAVLPVPGGYAVSVWGYPLYENRIVFLNEAGQITGRGQPFPFHGFGAYQMIRDWQGNLLVADCGITKLTPQGTMIWSQATYTSQLLPVTISALAMTPDSNYVALGFRLQPMQPPTKVHNFAFLKIAPDGQPIRDAGLYSFVDQYPFDVAVDTLGNYVLFGYSTDNSINSDFLLVKYQGWDTRLHAPENETTAALTISPNPSPDGRFTLHLTPSLPATLTITDALGRVVLTQAAPAPATLLNLSTQPPGLYALRLTWPDGRTLVRRLVR